MVSIDDTSGGEGKVSCHLILGGLWLFAEAARGERING